MQWWRSPPLRSSGVTTNGWIIIVHAFNNSPVWENELLKEKEKSQIQFMLFHSAAWTQLSQLIILSVFNHWYRELRGHPDGWDWLLLHWTPECCKLKMFQRPNELFLINTQLLLNSLEVGLEQNQNKSCMSGRIPIRLWINILCIFIHFYESCLGSDIQRFRWAWTWLWFLFFSDYQLDLTWVTLIFIDFVLLLVIFYQYEILPSLGFFIFRFFICRHVLWLRHDHM